MRTLPVSLATLGKFNDRHIAFNPHYVDVTGSITAALFLSQAYYWHNRTTDPDGWFYKTREEWTAEIKLTRTQQEGARDRLCTLGILEEDRRGLPARMYYRINIAVLVERLDALPVGGEQAVNGEEELPSTAEMSGDGAMPAGAPVGRKPANKLGGFPDGVKPANRLAEKIPAISEITTEITEEESSYQNSLLSHSTNGTSGEEAPTLFAPSADTAEKRHEGISKVKRQRRAPTAVGCPPGYSPGFEQFWGGWPDGPRKTKKTHCFTKWKQHKLEHRSQEVCAKVAAWKETDKWRRGFDPVPSNWIRDREYEDEVPVTTWSVMPPGQTNNIAVTMAAVERALNGKQ